MTQRENLKKRIRIGTIVLIAVLLISYGIFQARNLAIGPVISITAPINGETSSSTLITIVGKAENVSFMTLDGFQIFTDTDGNFSEDRVLYLGYNVLTFYARDKFGKEITKTLELTAE